MYAFIFIILIFQVHRKIFLKFIILLLWNEEYNIIKQGQQHSKILHWLEYNHWSTSTAVYNCTVLWRLCSGKCPLWSIFIPLLIDYVSILLLINFAFSGVPLIGPQLLLNNIIPLQSCYKMSLSVRKLWQKKKKEKRCKIWYCKGINTGHYIQIHWNIK